MTAADAREVRLLYGYYDCENIAALRAGRSALATFDYFDINAVLSYLARINIVARWTLLDAARGREMFDRLMAELDGKELIDKK